MIPQLQREAAVAAPESVPHWSLATRIGFRFVFSYFLLYIGPGAVGALGQGEVVTSYRALWTALWHRVVPWIGTNILNLKGDLSEVANGSGDQLYDYVLILCIFVAALLATGIWSLLDRKRTNYQQLYQWLRLFMRLLLSTAMMTYGASKILPMQFADIPLARFVDPLGHTSPMGLLWEFMGQSRAYSFFGGCAEMLGGLLLIVPRFTTLGALVSLGVLSNVLMLNLCYDVSRKIFTIHLVLIAIFLVLPDAKRLANLFIFNRTAEPAAAVPFLKDKQLNRGILVLQYLYCVMTLAIVLHSSYQGAVKNEARIIPSLRGIWSVDEFVLDNISLPPLVTNSQRWYRVVFDSPDLLTIQPMDGPLQLYGLKLDEGGKTIKFFKAEDPNWRATFALETPEKDRMLMTGQSNGHAISATLHRLDLSDPSRFLLSNRGFHWINQSTRWR